MHGFGIIAAYTRRSCIIGLNGGIPWTLREDRDYFKNQTRDGALLMGRGTWEESKIHLPHSKATIVMSTNAFFREEMDSIPNVSTASSFAEALESANSLVSSSMISPNNVWVVGGEAIYKTALMHESARELHLTEIEMSAEEEDRILNDGKRVARFPPKNRWGDKYTKVETVEGERSGLDGLPTYNFNVYKSKIENIIYKN
ncbi:hypothetical protein TL16_g06847 [Triparma laevis f. inornata]|uniref:dihydrofolate reductase n=2 Tax=Triparma laevis TaxID=1534972 RepID=A0A9W7FQ78_9STRA|nr:hypothetical protein TL16_g06847 [Triparma laevis f. inornata]GMI16214.1 hypothetical protein TrLO_g12957 [Triparma laevis f. longispina]